MMNFDAKTLREIADNIEHINTQIADLKLEAKAFYDTAKGKGINASVLRKVIAQRNKDPEKVRDEAELFELYAGTLQGDLFAPRHDKGTGEVHEPHVVTRALEKGNKVISFGDAG